MDIDIDFADPEIALKLFKGKTTFASMVEEGELKQHPVGVYFQTIPRDKETELAAIPNKEAEEFGYIKIDFLTVKFLKEFNIKNKNEIKELLKKDPDWTMLENEEIVKQLFQLKNQFHIVNKVKPKTLEELSDVLALIRPNKQKLLHHYLINKERTRKELYTKRDPTDYRRSHSIPYAMLVIINMHLLKEKLDNENIKRIY